MQIDTTLFSTDAPLHAGLRFEHHCSKGDRPLVVTRREKGWEYYCHRCRKGGIYTADRLSPQRSVEFYKSLNLKQQQVVKKVFLPKDFTVKIPAAGLAWLYTWGITEDDIKKYNLGYSPYYDRVILPVYWGDELIYWQGRNLGEITRKNPKYINIRSNRNDLYFTIASGTHCAVIVEDILSTIRVGHTMDCYGLLSAFIPDNLVLSLTASYSTVFLWLDPDKLLRTMDWMTRFNSLGCNTKIITSNHDPKYYNDREIERKLS